MFTEFNFRRKIKYDHTIDQDFIIHLSDDYGRFVNTSSRSLIHVYPPLRKDLISDNWYLGFGRFKDPEFSKFVNNHWCTGQGYSDSGNSKQLVHGIRYYKCTRTSSKSRFQDFLGHSQFSKNAYDINSHGYQGVEKSQGYQRYTDVENDDNWTVFFHCPFKSLTLSQLHLNIACWFWSPAGTTFCWFVIPGIFSFAEQETWGWKLSATVNLWKCQFLRNSQTLVQRWQFVSSSIPASR